MDVLDDGGKRSPDTTNHIQCYVGGCLRAVEMPVAADVEDQQLPV